jgi:glutamyl-tRNA reductase
VILSTCNRTELFGLCADNAERDVLSWLSRYHRVPEDELSRCYYLHQEQDAIRHLIEVASGLDSMVLGEPQIFGQLKSAFAVAREVGSVDVELARIFSHVFSVAKKVRTDTAIGENPVSVAYAAVNLSRHIFSDLSNTRALLIGAGETIELVARHLVDGGVKEIVVANRTLDRARDLALRFHSEAVLLSEIPEQLARADIVISSTASQLPILGKGAVEQALKQRKHRPILMIDLAVPRDIEEQVSELSDIYLYSVDDLTDIVDENIRSRESEARKADVIIAEGVEGYLQRLRSEDAVSTLKSYRSKAEQTRDDELQKALRQLGRGTSPEQVLNQLARNLTNKLIHSPSIHMKKAGAEGRDDLISWAQTLFGLDLDERNEGDE